MRVSNSCVSKEYCENFSRIDFESDWIWDFLARHRSSWRRSQLHFCAIEHRDAALLLRPSCSLKVSNSLLASFSNGSIGTLIKATVGRAFPEPLNVGMSQSLLLLCWMLAVQFRAYEFVLEWLKIQVASCGADLLSHRQEPSTIMNEPHILRTLHLEGHIRNSK